MRIYVWGERVRSVPRRHDRSLPSSSSSVFFFRSRTRQPGQHTIMWLLESWLRTELGTLIQIRPGEANSWLKRLLLSAPNTHWAQLSPPSDTAVLRYADLCNCATWKHSRRSSSSTQSSLTRLHPFNSLIINDTAFSLLLLNCTLVHKSTSCYHFISLLGRQFWDLKVHYVVLRKIWEKDPHDWISQINKLSSCPDWINRCPVCFTYMWQTLPPSPLSLDFFSKTTQCPFNYGKYTYGL